MRKNRVCYNREKSWDTEMAIIYTISVNKGITDESPMAYKSLSDSLDAIGGIVDIIDVMKPAYNLKPWKNIAFR